MSFLAILFLGLNVQPSYSQENELEKAKALKKQGIELYKQGRYTEAIPIFEEALAIDEKALGPDHPDVAKSLNNLAMVYQALGDYSKTEPLYKRSLVIFEKTHGANHPAVATSLNNLAVLYTSLGRYSKAKPLYKRSLAIREKALGPDHPDVAVSLNNLAMLYREFGDYSKTEPLYKRSLGILEKEYGADHPDVATSLNNLATLYKDLGDYSKAESLYKRSLAIREKALGPEHPDVAKSLNNLAMVYQALGDYSKAELLLKRSLAIREKALGPDHPAVATVLNNLAGVYKDLGAYSKTEPLYKRSLVIFEKTHGANHPAVATSLNNLAVLYTSLGRYSKAKPLYKRSLAIREKALGPDHPDVAVSLNNLAMLYREFGDYSKAETLLKRSLAIREKALGPDHPDVATSLNNLAVLYNSLGRYSKAKVLCKRALAITEKILGPDHPHVAPTLSNLAGFYQNLGDYSKAEALLKRSLAITERTLGSGHPHVVTCLANLAFVYVLEDNFRKAGDVFSQALQIDSKLIDQTMGFTSEEQKMKFLSMKKWNLDRFLSLVSNHLSHIPSMRKTALDIWLRRKGVSLEAQRRFQEALVYTDAPEATATLQKLSRVRGQLSRLTFARPNDKDLKVYKKRIADLKAQEEELEAQLSRLSQPYSLSRRVAKADCEELGRTLPANSALIEFAKIEMFDFKARERKNFLKPAHYLAFVLHAGDGKDVGMIDLGNAGEIDKAVVELRKDISSMQEKADDSSRKVYDLVFKPLRKGIGDVREIFISPDGQLNLIPFEVLQGPDGRYLIEDYTFNYLAAGRDLLRFGQGQKKGGKALLIGDPDFDMGMKEKNLVLKKLAYANIKQKEISRRSTEMEVFPFKRLPGTKQEVEAIQTLLGEENTSLYTRREALEEVLKRHGTPSISILHLATHGFFLKDQEIGDIPPNFLERGFHQFTIPKPKTRKRIKIENPMLRSGFALAGANRHAELTDEQADDGIVTSEEILGLRLRGTEMVVLSACDTGLGGVKAGEGVFGLRRAFAQVGAKSLIMSLWRVPDMETRELMVEFYKNVLKKKMNRCHALRQAALKQMKIVKDRYGYPYPLCWGGFVMVGDPGDPAAAQTIQ